MKKLFLFLALFGVLAVGCEELLPNEQTPADIPTEQPSETPEEKPTFNTDAEGNYVVDANGGEIVVTITTNLEYNIVIPDAAQSWLSVADTRVEVREEILTFIVAANESFEERSATVELTKADGEVLQAISFVQDAAIETEIWYTNGSTTEATTPNSTNAFGANIVSNTYDAEKECWVIKFDSKVTTIGDWAFYECISLTSVTIPDSVTTIGMRAFDSCYSLTSVTIPDSVTWIGSFAFDSCTSLTSVTIPDSVTWIGENTFYSCSSLHEFKGKFASEDGRCLIVDGVLKSFAPAGLTEYTILNSVTRIGDYAFYYCYGLTSVTIPDSVTKIGEGAFFYCFSLASVTIPDSVTTIGGGAFAGCNRLKEFKGKFADDNGRILVIDGTLNSFAPAGLTKYTTPDSVTTIGDYAFWNCESLTSVTIGDSVTTIGNYAFDGCYSLTSVTIPDSVTSIGEYAFEDCHSLTNVYCKAITPPAGGSYIFYGNASDRKIYVPMESVEAYKSAEGWSEYKSYIVGYNF